MTLLDGGGRTWAAVPFRGGSGKRRLAGLLDDEERGQLVLALLTDVLAALLAVPSIERVLVVAPAGVELPGRSVGWSGSPSGVEGRVVLLPERAEGGGEPIGLNPALARAQAVAVQAGVTRLLIVPADLPLLRPPDVAVLLRTSATFPPACGAVIAPDATRTGTNALALAPPAALSPRFGLDSYRVHLAQADERRIPCATVRRAGLELDLDTPADVARLLASGSTGRTLALARSLRLDERGAAWALVQRAGRPTCRRRAGLRRGGR